MVGLGFRNLSTGELARTVPEKRARCWSEKGGAVVGGRPHHQQRAGSIWMGAWKERDCTKQEASLARADRRCTIYHPDAADEPYFCSEKAAGRVYQATHSLARSLGTEQGPNQRASEQGYTPASIGDCPSTAVFNSEYVEYRLEHRATGPCGA